MNIDALFTAHKERERRARQAIRQDIAWLLDASLIPLNNQPTEANVYATLPLNEVRPTIQLSIEI